MIKGTTTAASNFNLSKDNIPEIPPRNAKETISKRSEINWFGNNFYQERKKTQKRGRKKQHARTAGWKATSSGRDANYDQRDQTEGSLGGRKNPPLPASVTFAVIGCLGGIGAATRFEDTTRQTGAPAERKDSKKNARKWNQTIMK